MQHKVLRDDPDYEDLWDWGALEYGITLLGLFRRKIGQDIERLADVYQLPIEGPLEDTVRMVRPLAELDKDTFARADALVRPYVERHGGFKEMKPGCSPFA